MEGGERSLRGAKPLLNKNLPPLRVRGCLVVIARHKVPKQSLKAVVRLLRFARNDNLSCETVSIKEKG